MNSPSFIACFADGQTTRMTVHTSLAKLDVGRGVRLAQHAYRSRMKQEPPAITSARFEDIKGKVLEEYDALEIAELAGGCVMTDDTTALQEPS
jgi:hypothetical protein